MARFDLTDFEWSVIEPLLANKPRGVPRVDDRRVLNGIRKLQEEVSRSEKSLAAERHLSLGYQREARHSRDFEKINSRLVAVGEILTRLGALDEILRRLGALDEVHMRLGAIDALHPRLGALDEVHMRLGAIDALHPRLAALEDIQSRLGALEDIQSRLGALEDIQSRLGALDDRINTIDEMLQYQGVKIPKYVQQQIATEVMFEKQRWGIAYKVGALFRRSNLGNTTTRQD